MAAEASAGSLATGSPCSSDRATPGQLKEAEVLNMPVKHKQGAEAESDSWCGKRGSANGVTVASLSAKNNNAEAQICRVIFVTIPLILHSW